MVENTDTKFSVAQVVNGWTIDDAWTSNDTIVPRSDVPREYEIRADKYCWGDADESIHITSSVDRMDQRIDITVYKRTRDDVSGIGKEETLEVETAYSITEADDVVDNLLNKYNDGDNDEY